MFSKSTLLTSLTLALAVAASPVVVVRNSPINIPLVKRYHARGGNKTLVERDLARLEALQRRTNIDVTNELFSYIVNVR